jgi:hypothetical protein
MVNEVTSIDQFFLTRHVRITWPEEDGPEVASYDGKKGRITAVHLSYNVRVGADGVGADAGTWDFGHATVEWAWYTKAGLGSRRQLHGGMPDEVLGLLVEHRPTTTVRVVETAL